MTRQKNQQNVVMQKHICASTPSRQQHYRRCSAGIDCASQAWRRRLARIAHETPPRIRAKMVASISEETAGMKQEKEYCATEVSEVRVLLCLSKSAEEEEIRRITTHLIKTRTQNARRLPRHDCASCASAPRRLRTARGLRFALSPPAQAYLSC